MKQLLIINALVLFSNCLSAQFRAVLHRDLIPQMIANSGFKITMNELYADKLNTVADNRQQTVTAATTIEEVQRKIFSSLTNVDDALRNGKTLIYISRKIPGIFDNLRTATRLAAGKPYLIGIAAQQGTIIAGRVVQLQTYLKDFVLKSNPKILMNPTDRERFLYEVYENISIVYSLSEAMVNAFKLYNLQDAVNRVSPVLMYVNMDRSLIKEIANKVKF